MASVTPDKHLARVALIVVDMQKDFISGALKVGDNAGDIVAPINALRRDIPFGFVAHTKDSHPVDHCSFVENNPGATVFSSIQIPAPDGSAAMMDQVMWPTHCVEGSNGWEFHDDLVVEENDYIQRKGTLSKVDSYSGFFDNFQSAATGLAKVLRDRDITDVYVCGLAYDYCAGSTACDASNLGFKTYLIRDLTRHVADSSSKEMDKRLIDAGVQIVQSDDISKRFGSGATADGAALVAGSDTELEELIFVDDTQSATISDYEQSTRSPAVTKSSVHDLSVLTSCGNESCDVTPVKKLLDPKRRRIHVPPN